MTINYKYFMFNQFSHANSGTSIDWDALNAASENNNDEVKFDDKKTQKLLDRTKKCIRSILLSSKGGTGIHEIGKISITKLIIILYLFIYLQSINIMSYLKRA